MTNIKNIIIIRHFKTSHDSDNNEKIIYDNALIDSNLFINFIYKYLKENTYIKDITFISSPQDRTIMTSLIICSHLKTALKNKDYNINDPIIDNILDRDPNKKINLDILKKYLKKEINEKFNGDTLYIFVTHSSIIYNLYKSIIEIYSKEIDFSKKHIYTNSLTYIQIIDINNEYKNLDNKKKKFKIISKFNLKIKKKNLELFLN